MYVHEPHSVAININQISYHNNFIKCQETQKESELYETADINFHACLKYLNS